MIGHLENNRQAEILARSYCVKNEQRYLSHEYYYHSNGRYNQLWIAVEDYSGRYEVRLDLNKDIGVTL